MSDVRHPYRLSPARQLVTAEPGRHVADLVQLVLLTAPNERLHHPDFGAGLGASALFEPLDSALASVIELRARASLERALGDRVAVGSIAVARVDDTTVEASVEYRLLAGGDPATATVRISG